MRKNIVEFPDRRDIEEEAAAWLIRLDAEQPPSNDELVSLREWLDRSPVHREELGGLATLWDKMNALTELAVPLGKPHGRLVGQMLGLDDDVCVAHMDLP